MNRKMWSAWLITAIVALGAVSVTQDAYANKKAAKKEKAVKVQQPKAESIEKALGEVKWGASEKELLDILKAQLFEEVEKDEKLKKDALLKQQARKNAMDRYAVIEKSKVELKGNRTGFEVSVVADEFTPNVGESLVHVRDKVAQRYYFFMHGRLYKMVVAYDKEYLKGVEFGPFAAQTAQRYGRPVSTDYGDVFGEEELITVTWQDERSSLSVHNKREFFSTFTMVFSDRARVDELTKRGLSFGGKGKKEKKQAEVSNEVAMLTRDVEKDRNSRVVDDMVGSVDIDLNEGRPEDEKINNDPAQPASGDSKAAAKGKNKDKPKAKPKPKKARPKFDEIDAGNSELVIY